MKWTATLAVAAALMYLDAVQSQCDVGWEEWAPGNCFYFLTSKADWYTAQRLCQAMGGNLAILSGEFHQKAIAYINDQPDGILDDEVFWIGGSDIEHPGSWEWVGGGGDIPLGPPHWYPCNGQPNNPDTQHHLCLYTPDFYFHSLESWREYYAICGKSY